MSENTTDNNFWKRKLAAFLHDPPHKPFRIAGHEDTRQSFWNEAHLSEEDFRVIFNRLDDHFAAAADRMIFPDPRSSSVRTDWKENADCAFHHPLGGEKLTPKTIHRSAVAAEVDLQQAQQQVGIQESDSWEIRWWKIWRMWPEIAARKHPLLAYLAADTRIPHHTLWHHNGLVSAFSTCDPGCSFLIFQIGPVQDFIKQARTTRDLWAGSFLLSYLISRAMFAVAKAVGPESIVYPQLRGAPLLDWFGFGAEGQFWSDEKRASHKTKGVREELLTPNLPNRFLALVPKDWRNHDGHSIADVGKKAVRQAWKEISGSVHDTIDSHLGEKFPGWDQFWEDQTGRFPVVDYCIHDWQDTAEVLEEIEKEDGTPPLHGGWKSHPLRDAIEWATIKIERKHLDTRCYKRKSWKEGDAWRNQLLTQEGQHLPDDEPPVIDNPGFAWALHCATAEWKFAAVKNARSFDQWSGDQGVEKDHLDGRNEVLGGAEHDAFWAAMRSEAWGEGTPSNLFKGSQEYGALTTIKRLYPFVWLTKSDALDSDAPRFESVQDIANAIDSEEESNKYYAILCLDGDDMGQWVGGTKTPLLKEVLSGSENDPDTPLGYFNEHWGKGWDQARVPTTPSFHAALSESLSNFSLYCARQIVEAFGGQLIYAGGDDVLAMLPAERAVDCADALQIVFRGIDPSRSGRSPLLVQKTLSEFFEFPAEGFIRCLKGTGIGEHCRPNWPLMVPGPKATASAGIAIGHVRSPMQDVIQAARDAEHAAKAVEGKGALAVRVLKRSGESVQFAARFDSGVPGIWSELETERNRLSSRFIYRFLSKLQPVLAKVVNGRASWEPSWQVNDRDLTIIAGEELRHSLANQSDFKSAEAKDRAERWMPTLQALDPENFLHFWQARAFLNRLAEPESNT